MSTMIFGIRRCQAKTALFRRAIASGSLTAGCVIGIEKPPVILPSSSMSDRPMARWCLSLPTFLSTLSFTRFALGAVAYSNLTSEELRGSNKEDTTLRVELISIENVKPSAPTPNHLRTYEVSGLDQFCSNIYMPLVYFYANNSNIENNHEMIMKRRQILKQSLSDVLTRFYPFAGKVDGVRFIDCNDEGVYYVEARANQSITSFINQPSNKDMLQLLPFEPNSVELLSNTHVVLVQTTIFECGGIAIGMYTSHKIVDAYSHTTFLNAWAAIAHGSSKNIIIPNFISPSIFHHDPTDISGGLNELCPSSSSRTSKYMGARFVFSAESLAILKQNTKASSRVLAVTALIWKCSMAASKEKCSSALRISVNLRERSSPPLPPYSIGNIFLDTVTLCDVKDSIGLLARQLKTTIDEVDSTYIETMKGKETSRKYMEHLEKIKLLNSENDPHHILVASMCNGGIYEADFGWGRPLWVSFGYAGDEACPFESLAYLMDTRTCRGIEAWVILPEEEMSHFECNAELLSYASLNRSPLQTIV